MSSERGKPGGASRAQLVSAEPVHARCRRVTSHNRGYATCRAERLPAPPRPRGIVVGRYATVPTLEQERSGAGAGESVSPSGRRSNLIVGVRARKRPFSCSLEAPVGDAGFCRDRLLADVSPLFRRSSRANSSPISWDRSRVSLPPRPRSSTFPRSSRARIVLVSGRIAHGVKPLGSKTGAPGALRWPGRASSA